MSWMRVLPSSCLAASLAACCTIRCSPAPPTPGTPAEASASIVGTLQRLIDADNARDLEKVLGCYAEDVIWLPPGEEPVRGQAAVRARYETLFASFQPAFTLEISEAAADGTVGYAWGMTGGGLTPIAGGATVTVDDRFVVVMRYEEDAWRVARLSWGPSHHEP